VALVPLLYLGVSSIVQDGYADLFVNPVRSYSKLVADELEASDPDQFDRRVVELLDSVMLTGQVQFAEVVDGQRKIHGTLSAAVPRNSRRDDSILATTVTRSITSHIRSSDRIAPWFCTWVLMRAPLSSGSGWRSAGSWWPY